MVNFKKALLITASTLTIAASAVAGDTDSKAVSVESSLKVKISGYADFQAGMRKQNHLGINADKKNERNVSNNKKHFAFFNSTALVANVSNKECDIEYGGKIILIPTAKRKASPTYNGSHIFLSSDYGRFEAGSPLVASAQMLIDGDDVAVTTSNWSRYAALDTDHLEQGTGIAPSFATSADFFLDDELTTGSNKKTHTSEPPRSVSYYTPKFNLSESTKLQVGASYTPDSSNNGADKHTDNSNPATKITIKDGPNGTNGTIFDIDKSVKNAISGGIALEQNISDGVDFKIALTGETGKAAGKMKKFANEAAKKDGATPEEYKLSNLRTYNIGAALTVGNFSYSAAYGSLGKSLTAKEYHKSGRRTNFYSGAVAYNQGAFGASITYFKGSKFKNTVDSVSIATTYLMAPGFKPYAAISAFSAKAKPEYFSELSKKKTRGTVAVIGAKLSM